MWIMKECVRVIAGLLGLVCLLPFLGTAFLSGIKIQGDNEDWYLPVLLYSQIDGAFPEEVIKAQAVLVRTNTQAELNSGENMGEILSLALSFVDTWEEYRKFLWKYSVFQKAFVDTEEVLVYENQICPAPYHESNGGSTRSGREVFYGKSYEYLDGVESPGDAKADEWKISLPKDFRQEIEILSRDSAGYVMEIQAGNTVLSGEEFRRQLNLPSANFYLQGAGEKVVICGKGRGHGLGMSQQGANYLAHQGKDYLEILGFYFPKMEILKKDAV
jgi:stage II sporulation protein D